MNTKFKIEFANGCFDDFDGTQEELDSMVQELTQLVESGDILNYLTITDSDVDFDDFNQDEELFFTNNGKYSLSSKNIH